MDQERIPLAIDVAKYEQMDATGMLHIVTGRDGGQLIGYFMAFVFPHLHYCKSGLMSFVDVYYMRPMYRTGGLGLSLFLTAESTLKARGVTKMYGSCKAHQDHTKLFTAMGWKLTDLCFTKWIGG